MPCPADLIECYNYLRQGHLHWCSPTIQWHPYICSACVCCSATEHNDDTAPVLSLDGFFVVGIPKSCPVLLSFKLESQSLTETESGVTTLMLRHLPSAPFRYCFGRKALLRSPLASLRLLTLEVRTSSSELLSLRLSIAVSRRVLFTFQYPAQACTIVHAQSNLIEHKKHLGTIDDSCDRSHSGLLEGILLFIKAAEY